MQPVFIVAARASGVRELASILNGNGLACLTAAFDFANHYDYAFAQFLRRANVGAAELITAPDQVLDDYLSHCASLVRAERFSLELRHHSMHLFNGRAWQFGHQPHLVTYLRQRQFRVVHFRRRNVFEHSVRLQMAQNVGEGEAPAANLDIGRCKRDLDLLKRTSKWMTSWFQGYDRYHDLAWEAVFEGGAVSDAGVRLLESLFDIPLANRTPPLPLVHHDLARRIGNAEEVMAALADSPHAREAAALLGGGPAS